MLSTPPLSGSPPSLARAIVLLAVASFASQALVRAADPLLPQIAADFDVTVGQAAIVVTAYAVTHGSIQLVIGPIGDRFGKYRAIAAACAVSAVTVALCGFARSLHELAFARFASGLTIAWILPLGLAFIGDVVPYEQRQHVLGRFLAGQVLGQLFGQAAGGVIGDYLGWRAVFLLLALMFAVAAAALAVELAANPLTRPRGTARRPRGLRADYASIFTNRWARFVLLVVFLEGTLLQGVFSFVGADLHLRFGLSFAAIGLIVACFGLGGLAYAAAVKPLMDRIGQAGIANGGGLFMAAAFLTLAMQPVWWPAPLAVLLIGLGFYMLHNTLQTVGTQMAPEARGTSVALFASLYFLGQTTGVTVAAPVMDRFGGPPLFIVSALLLPVLAFWFTRRLRRGG